MFGTLLVLAALSRPLLSAGPADPERALQVRLARIETAFKTGDAVSLRSSFSDSGKVRVDLKDLPDGLGSYGPGQLQVIFGHIFDECRTQEFAFQDNDGRNPRSATTFARGRWVRRNQPRGQERVDTLTFTLRQESGDWRILEIRSSR
jgi:hypothetical protein